MFMARRDEHSESSLMMPKSILHESGQSITQAAEDKAIVRFKGQRRGGHTDVDTKSYCKANKIPKKADISARQPALLFINKTPVYSR